MRNLAVFAILAFLVPAASGAGAPDLASDLAAVLGLDSTAVASLVPPDAPSNEPREAILRQWALERCRPAIDLDSDLVLAQALEFARRDSLVAASLARSGTANADSAFHAFVQDNAAEAWSQIIGERHGFAIDPYARWGTRDGANRVLAHALYDLLLMEPKDAPLRPMRAQLLRWIEERRLAPGEILLRFLSFHCDERRPTTREDALTPE